MDTPPTGRTSTPGSTPSSPAPLRVPTSGDRTWDIIGAVCLVVGSGLYFLATHGMNTIVLDPRSTVERHQPVMMAYEQWWQISRIGFHLSAAGLGISVLSAIRFFFKPAELLPPTES
jgi:hypothetical protein